VITSSGPSGCEASQRQRPVVTSWAAAENTAGRSRLGSQRAGFCNQGEHRHPGEEVECDLDDLQPDPVLGGVVQG